MLFLGCSSDSSSDSGGGSEEIEGTEQCSITFVSESHGQVLNKTEQVTKGQTVNFPVLNQIGYKLSGWYNEAGNEVNTSDKIEKDETFKAKWSPITYTINFDANGGSGEVSSIECKYDTEYNLPNNSFTVPIGYKKTDGWANTKIITPISKVYEDGEKIKNLSATDGASVTLYAVYSKGDYTATFVDYEDMLIEKVPCDKNETLSSSKIPTIPETVQAKLKLKVGYKLKDGWYDTEGNAVNFTTYQVSKNVTFKLKTTPISYTIHFDANTCTGTVPSDIACKYDADATLQTNGLTAKAGYKVNGWNTVAGTKTILDTITYSGTHYDGGETVKNLSATDGATVTLYSEYKYDTETECTITLESEYGTLTDEQKSFKVKCNDTIYQSFYSASKLPILSENGYTFGKWAVKGEPTAFATTLKVTSDMTFVALWTPYTAQIEFQPNKPTGATNYSGDMALQTINFGETTPLNKNQYATYKTVTVDGTQVKRYYHFKGWTQERTPTADNKIWQDGGNILWKPASARDNGKITLYAQWEELPLSIDILLPTVTKPNDIKLNYDATTKLITATLKGWTGKYSLFVDASSTPSLTSEGQADANGKGTFNPFNLTNLTAGTHTISITAQKDGIEYSQTLVMKIIEG